MEALQRMVSPTAVVRGWNGGPKDPCPATRWWSPRATPSERRPARRSRRPHGRQPRSPGRASRSRRGPAVAAVEPGDRSNMVFKGTRSPGQGWRYHGHRDGHRDGPHRRLLGRQKRRPPRCNERWASREGARGGGGGHNAVVVGRLIADPIESAPTPSPCSRTCRWRSRRARGLPAILPVVLASACSGWPGTPSSRGFPPDTRLGVGHLLDKTGTLTKSEMTIEGDHPIGGRGHHRRRLRPHR